MRATASEGKTFFGSSAELLQELHVAHAPDYWRLAQAACRSIPLGFALAQLFGLLKLAGQFKVSVA